ncbi:hypothetical protein ACQY0O_003795 [Thecaphora frezii]
MLPTSRTSKFQSVALTAGAIYVSAWGIYYIAQETIRKSILRKRKRSYPLQAPLLPPHALAAGARVAERVGVLAKAASSPASSSSSSTSPASPAPSSPSDELQQARHKLPAELLSPSPQHRPDNWYGNASEHEVYKIHRRFASLKVLGRWANVVPEWREQGAWEWFFWKGLYSLFYKPRIWWDGGLKRDLKTPEGRQKVERLLPVQHIDTLRLWGTANGDAADDSGKSTYKGKAKLVESPEAAAAVEEGITFTWIGQSTCLIQMHGLTILTDPVFGTQPIESIFSPTRMRPMPCTFSELLASGRIDVILLTHNHFDHLDVDILPLVPRSVQWYVPLGLTPLLVEHGIAASQITELDWWVSATQTLEVRVRPQSAARQLADRGNTVSTRRQLSVTAVPASHWSARTPLDTNTTLWNSYSVRVSPPAASLSSEGAPREARLFFCGDTGYSPSLFTAIGRCLGPFDVAAVPIGSYEPRWHMSIQHMHVVESVQVVKDVGARCGFAMHWGTWQMSDERWDDPPRELADEIARRGEPAETLRCVGFGETVEVAKGGDEVEV